uniref:Cytochrome c oxidase subunit 3 n=1 Tax=Spadella cephaloptera TaxID=52888 RepID=Q5VB06_9BILA|nr:cytochrome c oxidase subunit III [Spadella cephaloptera]AAT08487.1 cytochrome c oxidase subunit III [Spadella cephaloptera]
MTKHAFHIVDPSPWPLTGAVGALLLVSSIGGWAHKYSGMLMIFAGLILTIATMFQWWRDVTREATFQGKHTEKVQDGMRFGMILFITSEVFFFLAFFWAFFHSSLSPNVEVGSQWPPTGITPINSFDVPLLNTTVLLTSGATVTWAHMPILKSRGPKANLSLLFTVTLGLYFTLLQAGKYVLPPFSMANSVYGKTFYIATGFHGLHVIMGTLFIASMLYRHMNFHFSQGHHFEFKPKAGYWLFENVVGLFWSMCIYGGEFF